ncbi:hypothetical protein ZIOFF_001192 [Zingiber officinale]|uniref:Peptidase M24 domain-containing protein n=1 Tax=Zingiber officinale TaxID=94328 RepID=A0A8J5LUV7_ZINOF|nr:hypothetical protein ZIOFF_001192 [Zingiber officinale]
MSDDEAREEKELDLTFPDVVTKYKTATEIVNKALQLVVSQCKPKARVVDLFEKGDSFIRELSSFPVSFDWPSTSNRFDLAPASSLRGLDRSFPLIRNLWGPLALYHACIPLFQAKLGNAENVLEENDIVKIDMGCHIDGFITVVAHTHVIQEGPVTGRATDVIAAANTAAEVALRLVRPGKKKDLVTPDSSSPSSGTCSSGPPPSAKDATCYMSSTQSSPVDQDDKDGSGPEGHVTEPAMETMEDKFLNPIQKQDKNRLTVHGPQISSSRCKPFLTSHKEKTSHQATSVVDETRVSTNRKVIVRSSYFKHKPSDVNSLHRPNDGATDGNENNDCIPGGYPVKKRKLSEDNENQPPILVMNQENLPSKNARTSVHHGEDNQVSRLNNNGAMVREGGKFGRDISHVNNYTTVAERSMDRFAALMSSFRYTQSSARASVLRAPLKDVQNSSSSARYFYHLNL